jgi:hypothetical protein
MLPSKTVPEVNKKGYTRIQKAKAKMATAPPKKKTRPSSVQLDQAEDGVGPRNNTLSSASISPSSSLQTHTSKTVCPILFYARFYSDQCFRRGKIRNAVPSIYFTRSSQTGLMGLQETKVMYITVVFMARTRFVRSKGP